MSKKIENKNVVVKNVIGGEKKSKKKIGEIIVESLFVKNGKKDSEGREYGLSDIEIVKRVKKIHGNAVTSVKCVAWYRSKVNNDSDKIKGLRHLYVGKKILLRPKA